MTKILIFIGRVLVEACGRQPAFVTHRRSNPALDSAWDQAGMPVSPFGFAGKEMLAIEMCF